MPLAAAESNTLNHHHAASSDPEQRLAELRTDLDQLRADPSPRQETGHPTLTQLLLRWEACAPDHVGMRHKELGRWREITYAEWAHTTRRVGAALHALGVRRGDRVGIHAENRPEWFHTSVGAQGLGAVVFGIYPTSPAAEVSYHLRDAGATVLIAEDQEQLDKALEVLDDCPTLEHVIVVDPAGTDGPGYDDPRLLRWDQLLADGDRALASDPDLWDREVACAEPDDVAVIIYTSGTTGPPKGAMLTWRNITWAIRCHAEVFDVSPADEVVSYLPLCHVAEQVMSLYDGLGRGVRINFAEAVETVQRDLAEVRPTLLFMVPRISEKMLADIEIRVRDASSVKRLSYRAWRAVGTWLANRRLARRPHRIAWYEQPVRWLSWLFLFRSIKKHTGLSRVRIGFSGGAPINPDVLAFFLAMDVPIIEAYGQTECTGMATTNQLDDMRLGTVGRPFPGVEVALATDGEILVRGDNVFAGYWQRPEATAETIDADGWLHTGDVGEWTDDGRLKITDRKKDIIITSGGKNLSPSEIENTLKASPYIREAMVEGDGRKYVTALIQVEYDTVSDYLQQQGVPFTTYRDLTEKPEVGALIEGEVERANERLARVEQVKAFRLLPRELDQDDNEVTATQKIKRQVVAERYKDLIEEMYAS